MRLMFIFLLYSYALNGLASATIYLAPKAFIDVVKGMPVYNKVIGINEGRISFIGDSAPGGEKVLPLKNTFILPGLVDCHSHIFFTQLKSDKNFEDALIRETHLSDDFRLKRAKDFLKDYLEEGFTSVCDLGNSGSFLDAKLKKEINHDPTYPGLFISGPGLVSGKGQFFPNTPSSVVRQEYMVIEEEQDFAKILQKYKYHNVDIFKIYADNSPGVGGISDEVIKKLYELEQINSFKKITFHAIEKNSVDRLMKLPTLNLEHASNALWADNMHRDVNLTLTDLPEVVLKEFDYYQKAIYLHQVARAKKAYQNGFKLIFGPDFYFHRLESGFNRAFYVKKSVLAWEEAKISNADILRAMTIAPALALKLQKDQGSIEIGAKANLIGVIGNPLEKIARLNRPHLIINKGVIIKAPTMNMLQKKP